jgi:hypothetical protein
MLGLSGLAWKAIGAAVLALTIAGLAGTIALERAWRRQAEAAVAVAQHERDAAIKIANDNATVLQHERDAMQRRLADLSAQQASAAARARGLAAQLERNNRAPASDDGPMAPVLRRQLDVMRARPADGHPAPARRGAIAAGFVAQLPRPARPAGP